MAYQQFAHYYDELNQEADYNKLSNRMKEILCEYGINDGIVADLGCGTGELTLRLAAAGYDMIGVDVSADMLSELRQKVTNRSGGEGILLLCQDLAELDLYGTIRAAVASFDVLNHFPEEALQGVLSRVALFLEMDGLLIFDMNTRYKHEQVLAEHSFEVESRRHPGLLCRWQNQTNRTQKATEIRIVVEKEGQPVFEERFTEYYFEMTEIRQMLQQQGLHVLSIEDGERFGLLQPNSQRVLVVAQKR